MKLAFIGLGVMGYPMAGHLQRAGYDVCVYNRTTEKAVKWSEEYQGRYAETPALAAEGSQIVFICVGNDDDVRAMIAGTDQQAGVLSALTEGGVIVDHTTTSDSLAREMADLAQSQGKHFMDAPVSGGQLGAENGQLAIMLGGDDAVFEQVAPVIDSYSKSITHMGGVGAGQATKMVNQVLIAGVLQGIAEGFALANKSGLEIPQVIEAVSGGAAGSWQLSNRGLNINNDKFDYGFAIDWMRKDLGFCLDAAAQYGIELPNAKYVDQCYEKLQQQGHSRSDTSVLVKQYDKD